MPAAPGATRAVGMVPDELKWEPKSKGLSTPRKKKPKDLAVITECCTGCAGSPACVEYCPVEDCMFWVPYEGSGDLLGCIVLPTGWAAFWLLLSSAVIGGLICSYLATEINKWED